MTRTAAQNGARSRRKGKAWEQKVARLLREELGLEARRGWQARKGDDAPDVIVDGQPWWVECKCGKMPNPRAALRQCEEAAPAGHHPMVVIHDDAPPGGKAREWVAMPLESWIALARAAG